MKNQLRKLSLEKRKTINNEVYSEKILKKLFSLEEYKKSQNILCYYPLKYEINVLPCFEDTSKNWFLPRVNGENLEICPYCKEKLKIGHFKIYEPLTENLKTNEIIEMVIIPCVAADRKGYRLGYGKGYYDRFLSSISKNTKKILLVYSDLLFQSVFPESHDVNADIIITDKEILRVLC